MVISLLACAGVRYTTVKDYVRAPGDVVAFHRSYKRIGVEKGDERRVAVVDQKNHTVILESAGGETASWKPNQVAGRHGGAEVYRAESIELRQGDRIRWTRNDTGLGLVNSQAEAEGDVGLARSGWPQSDDVLASLDPATPGKFQHLHLV